MIVHSLGSGSSGNAFLVELAGGSRLLVDCGLPPRHLLAQLALFGLHPRDISAVLVTHEHSDHISAVGTVRRHGATFISTEGTARAAGFSGRGHRAVTGWDVIEVEGALVTALPTSHDATDPCGYLVESGGHRACFLTDLGHADPALVPALERADLIVLEANHDVDMLRTGPYPEHLKRRVLSRLGHLSNIDCGGMLADALGGSRTSRSIWLAHLSETNNRPGVAERTVRDALRSQARSHQVRALPRRGAPVTWVATTAEPPRPEQLTMFGSVGDATGILANRALPGR